MRIIEGNRAHLEQICRVLPVPGPACGISHFVVLR